VGRDVRELNERSRRMQHVFEPLAGVAIEAVPGAARAHGWVVGSPTEIVAHLVQLRQAGVQRAILGHYLHADDDALELIAAEIMPRLRESN
jgi:alkanesulfonate monooxygenase SsuD/methylene tetrahydromethanopterin reductase-like flavin-dependent oxidoreductase (luciferase family)